MSHRGVPLTGLPAGAISSTHTVCLTEGWSLAGTTPGAIGGAEALGSTPLEWRAAHVPGTVAQAVGPDDLDAHEPYDARDWWYRCSFPTPEVESHDRVRIRFDGLATIAEAWLNGTRLLEAQNMFVAHAIDVTNILERENELVLVFRSLAEALQQKRRRPRWKTKLVEHQQLRWFRTTLLGRIPGWTPPVQAVGPWRPVWLEVVRGPDLVRLDVRATLEGGEGVVRIDGECHARRQNAVVGQASLRVGEDRFELAIEGTAESCRIHGEARIPDPELWWPKTHGEAKLHECELSLSTPEGTVTIQLGRVGFRDIGVDTSGESVRFVVNGVPVFCRGACWTSNDIVSLTGSEDRMRRTLALAADAHANMVRLGGTMVYETDAFYRACDELGLMVWQDLMFANMDYPVDDPDFRASVEAETAQHMKRLQRHPSVVAVCGGSEVEQQAAMFGAPKEVWTNDFFSASAPGIVREVLGDRIPYWTSTPTGGALPFHASTGIAHYFGVGAYLRPLDDARTAGVRFTPECLGFSNVPEPENLRGVAAPESEPSDLPAWKRGVPRDSGTSWDFEDVRDHYLRLVFGVDPVERRSQDLGEYLALSRVVTGRVVARVFDEWRSPENPCWGGLVWFLQDLRPGAGWGIIDSDNRPKAAYQYLRRAWAPVRITLLDRGLDGLRIEVHNETPRAVEGQLEVEVFGASSTLTAKASKPVTVGPRSSITESVDALIGYFTDSTYAYRFGPLAHAAVVARVRIDGAAQDISALKWSDLVAPLPPAALLPQLRVEASKATVTVETDRLVRDLRFEVPGWIAENDYVDLAPGHGAVVSLRRLDEAPLQGYFEAANVERTPLLSPAAER